MTIGRESAWHHTTTVDLEGEGPHGIAAVAGAFIVATGEAVFRVTLDGAVERLAAIAEKRRSFGFGVADDLVLLLGGHDGSGHHDGKTFGLDLGTRVWAERSPMPSARADPTIAVGDGRVHVVGGRRTHGVGSRFHDEHYVLDIAQDAWEKASALLERRAGGGAAVVGDHLHVIGGTGGSDDGPLRQHETHHLDTGESRREPDLPSEANVVGASGHQGRLAVLMDDPEQREPQHLLPYDAAAGVWERVRRLPVRLGQPVLCSHKAGVVVAGSLPGGGVGLLQTHLADG
jgi:hypothetical protein